MITNKILISLFIIVSLIVLSINVLAVEYANNIENNSQKVLNINLTAGVMKQFSISNSNTYTQNPENIFKLYDNFTTLDTTKWGTAGSVSQSGEYLIIAGDSNVNKVWSYKNFSLSDYTGYLYTLEGYGNNNKYYSGEFGANDSFGATDPASDGVNIFTGVPSQDTQIYCSINTDGNKYNSGWQEFSIPSSISHTASIWIRGNNITFYKNASNAFSLIADRNYSGLLKAKMGYNGNFNTVSIITKNVVQPTISCALNICNVTSNVNLINYNIVLPTIYSGNVNISEISDIVIPLVPTYILNLSSVPSINTTTTDIIVTLKVTANNTNLTNDYATIYYKLYTGLNNNCAIFYQNVCVLFDTISYKNMTKINATYFNTTLGDENFMPAYYPYNITTIQNTEHNNDTIWRGNNILWNISNFSTEATQYNILYDIDTLNGTSTITPLSIYYCNSSYNGNTKPEIDTNCVLANSFDPTIEYQKHSEKKSKYQTIVLGIMGIKKTQQSYIIARSSSVLSSGGWLIRFINGTTDYNNKSYKVCDNNFVCVVTSKIYDIHIHAFLSTDYFSMYTILYDNTTTNTSNTILNYLNLTPFKPTAPFINSPCGVMVTLNGIDNVSLFFNWTPSFSVNNLSLLYNLSLSHNASIITGLNNTFYNWSFINYTNGIFNPVVTVYDSIGLFTERDGINCQFNICINHWVRTLQPCVNYVKLINYSDINYCNQHYNIPLDNSLFEECSIPTNPDLLNIYNGTIFIGITIIIIAILIFFYKRNSQ